MTDEEKQAKKEAAATLFGEAVTRVQAETPRCNFMVIGFGYNKIVVPFDAGTIIVAQMKMAESYEKSYSSSAKITPIKADNGFSAELLSHAEYSDIKVAALLEISPEDVKVMRLASESLVKKEEQQ